MKKSLIAVSIIALLCVSGALALSIVGGPFANKDDAAAAAKDPAFYNNLGVTLAQAGRADEAVTAFHQAIALNPSYEKARSNLATLEFQQSDYAAAIEQLRWLTANVPSNGGYHFDLGQNLASDARYKTGSIAELTEAASEFDTAAADGVAHAAENAAVVRQVIADVTA